VLPIHLALVSLTPAVAFNDLAKVSAALQKQLVRDFGPIWTVEATIDPFVALEDVPAGYWKILVVDTFARGGQHRDRNNQPYALVAAGSSWSLVASHEALEMLADPFGNRLVAGQSPMPAQGRVEFLVEVCDPCQSDDFGYSVNGVLVCDFYTPKYFDPMRADGVRYSFTGAITNPREVLPGGYLTWRDPLGGEWFQHNYMGAAPQFKNLGNVTPANNSIRAMIDELTPETRRLANLDAGKASMRRAVTSRRSADAAAAAEAKALRALIDSVE
jgi:hypothetical protein